MVSIYIKNYCLNHFVVSDKYIFYLQTYLFMLQTVPDIYQRRKQFAPKRQLNLHMFLVHTSIILETKSTNLSTIFRYFVKQWYCKFSTVQIELFCVLEIINIRSLNQDCWRNLNSLSCYVYTYNDDWRLWLARIAWFSSWNRFLKVVKNWKGCGEPFCIPACFVATEAGYHFNNEI